MKTKALPRGSARIVTAPQGPALPLLNEEGGDHPTYRGPLGTARLLIRRDRYLTEFYKYGRHNCFLSTDPAGNDCREWGLSYVSMEDAIRGCLGAYFSISGYDNDTLRRALRSVLDSELNQLGEP